MTLPEILRLRIQASLEFRPDIKLTTSQWHELASLCLLNLLGRCPDVETAEAMGVAGQVLVIWKRIVKGWDISGGWR